MKPSEIAFAENWARGPAAECEGMLRKGVRRRGLSVHALFVGIFLTKLDRRPQHHSEVFKTLEKLPVSAKTRLGVPRSLTYRQVERLYGLVVEPLDPTPVYSARASASRRQALTEAERADRAARRDAILDRIIDETIPSKYRDHSSHTADWSDRESWGHMVPTGEIGADANAHWGQRHSTQPGQRGEKFYGYHEQVVTMTRDEDGPAVPELVRGMTFSPAATTQAPLLTDLLGRLVANGLQPGDLLADSGYTNIGGWTLSMWALGFRPVIDLHPNQQGKRGAYQGALIVDDLLLSPGTPKKLQVIKPPGFGASAKAWAAYDAKVALRNDYVLVPFGRRDADGYQRYMCPASAGHVCCALKETSVSVELTRLSVPRPPKHPPLICAQATITVPPTVADKARQKHRWKSKAWRKSYRRRTAVERSWAYTKSKASVDLTHGNVRLMGCTKNALMHAIAWAVVNYRLLTAWDARQVASSTPSVPRSRRRRRDQTYADATRQESRPSSRAP